MKTDLEILRDKLTEELALLESYLHNDINIGRIDTMEDVISLVTDMIEGKEGVTA
jgi:hypothetical protein